MMLFRIAEIVGSTVADLHDKISYKEFEGWVSYLNTKGPDVAEVQMAVLSNLVASGLGAKNSKVDNFLISSKSAPTSEHTAFDSFAGVAKDYEGPKK